MTRVAPLLSKAAAIALTALVLLALYLVLVSPVVSRLELINERIDEQRQMLGRLEELLETTQSDSASDAAALQSINFVFLAGHSEQIKAASLQARIRKAADDAGIRLSSLAIVPPRSEDGVRVVGVDLQFQTDLRRLQDLLIGLETKRPMVLVDALHVSRAADASDRPERELDVRLTALGIVGKAEKAP